MKLIAKRGDLEAWADKDFDPKTDEVKLVSPGSESRRVRWQSALKWGYWNEA